MKKPLRLVRFCALAFTVVMLSSLLPIRADETDAITQALIPAPPRVQATGVGPTAINVAWKDVSRLEMGYELQVATSEAGPYVQATIPQILPSCGAMGLPKNSLNPGNILNVDPNNPDPNGILGGVMGSFYPYDENAGNGDQVCGKLLTALPHVVSGQKPTAMDPFPPSSPQIYWFRIRTVIPGTIGAHNPNGGDVSLGDSVAPSLIHGPWSGADAALLGPKAATNFAVSIANFPTAKLTWTNNATGDPAYCRNQFSREPDFPTAAFGVSPLSTSIFDGNSMLADTQYTYHLSAVRCASIPLSDDPNVAGDQSEPTHIENSYSEALGNGNANKPGFIITTPPIPPPATPTNLLATYAPTDSVILQWKDNSNDEDGFLIEYGPSCTNFTAQTAVQTPDGQAGGLGIRQTMQFNVLPETIRCYRVFAYRVSPLAKSAPSNTSDIFAVPKAPSNLHTTSVTSFAVTLEWTDNSKIECQGGSYCAPLQTTGFRVDFCDPAIFNCTTLGWAPSGLVLGVSGTGGTATLLDGRFAGTTLKYRVVATNNSGDSPPSNAISVTTPAAPLTAPTNLTATAGGPHFIQLKWFDSPNDNGYKIEYSDTGGTGKFYFLANAPANAIVYDDLTALGGHTRCYRVRATNTSQGQQSDPSNVACATTPAGNFPAAPNQLQGAPSTSNPNAPTKVAALQWQDNSSNETGFVIEVSTDNGASFHLAGQVGANVQTLKAGNYEPHSIAMFRVKAYNNDGDSAYSNVVSVLLLGPSKPIWLHPLKDGQIDSTACQADGKYALSQGVGPPNVNSDITIVILRKTGTMSGTSVTCNTIGCSDTFCQNLDGQACEVYSQIKGLKVEFNWNGSGTFRLQFHFAMNIIYELHAFAMNADGSSADAFIPNYSVAADCPTG